ncbi:MAG: biosynthetic-type acetolactate synthase large subunit [Syntrophaceticus schinkii]|jgi:acetolactate synthase-1/2/3 large subunit|nr:biosynthetic-type acetolactate synthase large subunit [Syntrophaceticus schinkii]MDD4261464.1 biosynthetic-type acetolactate synthase large subunit [Syntrophaceticus schinkii]MDD4674781.1 biosynthetic-type acetolactate synthase large subunit [Syntrophaceticus schinkii]
MITGAEIIIKSLEEEGVEVVFGYPGGAVIPLYDKLYDSSLKHVLVRHEQAAAHAADGYARATGKTGVAIATSGPGATNLVTGIATAAMDSIPMVVFTGQVALPAIGRDSFQEADITGITLPIVKHSYLVRDVNELAATIRAAFHLAGTGRRGPVLIDLPKDIQTAMAEFSYPQEINFRGYRVPGEPKAAMIYQAAKTIGLSRKPVIYAGGGVITSGAAEELTELAEKAQIPVTTTLMGKGSIPENHSLSLGMLGMHGTVYANYAISESDLLIAVGARFSDRVTGRLDAFAPQAKVIHIDIDLAEIGKNVRAHYPLHGDVKVVLRELLKRIEAPQSGEWLEQIARWKEEYPLTYQQNGDQIKPQYVIEQICELTKGEAIITTEVGQNQMWAAQYYKAIKPRCFISSGGLGTMGYGLPAAVGAQTGCPDDLVISVSGDGSFQMNMQELATIVQCQLPVKIAILNNGYLGMVRQWQELFHDKRYSQTELIPVPDYVKLAEAYGIKGCRVQRSEDVRPVLEQAIKHPGPVLMDFVVAKDENVYPMVPPGGSLTKMMGG